MEKMRMSLSFKENEKYMWEHIKGQLNGSYYIKQLIHNDIYRIPPTCATSLAPHKEQEEEQGQEYDLLAIEF